MIDLYITIQPGIIHMTIFIHNAICHFKYQPKRHD